MIKYIKFVKTVELSSFQRQTGFTPSVKVVFTGSENLQESSKYSHGTYNYLGTMKSGGYAIYMQSEKDWSENKALLRPFIFNDIWGGKNWIGSVIIALP